MYSSGKGKKKRFPVAKVKGGWTLEEDRRLMELVKEHGVRKWSYIAGQLQDRIGKQCRERWFNHLRPDIKSTEWTEEEELRLINAHKKCGNKWAAIARMLNGRTENSVKNHWNATLRRKDTMQGGPARKAPNGEIEPTALRDYLRELYGWKGDSTPVVPTKRSTKRKKTSQLKKANLEIIESCNGSAQDTCNQSNESTKATLTHNQLLSLDLGTPTMLQDTHAGYNHNALDYLMLQWEDDIARAYGETIQKPSTVPLEDQLGFAFEHLDDIKLGACSPDTVLLSPTSQNHLTTMQLVVNDIQLPHSSTSSSSSHFDEFNTNTSQIEQNACTAEEDIGNPSSNIAEGKPRVFGVELSGLEPLTGDVLPFMSALEVSAAIGSPHVDKRRRVGTVPLQRFGEQKGLLGSS